MSPIAVETPFLNVAQTNSDIASSLGMVGEVAASTSPTTLEELKNSDAVAQISPSDIYAVVPFLQQIGGVKRHFIVHPNADPPTVLEGSSVVYVLHIDFGNGVPALFYVGETESIRQRLAQHR